MPSIRSRLARALLLVTLVWSLAAGVAVWLVVRHALDRVLDHALQESGELLHGMLAMPATATVLAQATGSALPAPPHQENLVWQVVSPGQRVLLRSHGAPTRPWLDKPTPGLSDGGTEWRLYGMVLQAQAKAPAQGPTMVYVAQPAWERREAQLEAALFSALAALLVGAAGTAWLRHLLRKELQPLEQLSQAVAGYDPLDPSQGLPRVDRAELLPMLRAINTLGERVARRLASERAISAHAAHALRTPLAGIDAQLAVALRDCPEALRARLQRVRGASQRLQQVVPALLALFRSGAEPQWQRVNLAGLVHRLPVANQVVHTQGLAELDADPDLLTAALANLLDNAARHGATRVTVDAQAGDRGMQLRLCDNGPGMAADLRSALAAELATGRYARPLGMGLMLADLVARAHGGHAQLPPQAGPGCTVVLQLLQPAR